MGHEFSSVEALWSQFEGVMAKEPEPPATATKEEGQESKMEEDGDEQTERVKEEEDKD